MKFKKWLIEEGKYKKRKKRKKRRSKVSYRYPFFGFNSTGDNSGDCSDGGGDGGGGD